MCENVGGVGLASLHKQDVAKLTELCTLRVRKKVSSNVVRLKQEVQEMELGHVPSEGYSVNVDKELDSAEE